MSKSHAIFSIQICVEFNGAGPDLQVMLTVVWCEVYLGGWQILHQAELY